MNILLTGSTGFLGGKLISNLLIDEENQLFLLVRNVSKAEKLKGKYTKKQQSRIHFIKGDIILPMCGISQIESIPNKIDVFYHLAALVKFDLDLKDELFSINYQGTKHAIELALKLKTERFFYVSTAYTVGNNEQGDEKLYSLENKFNNPYEESKVKSENFLMTYKNKMDISIFRPAIIVGDSKTGEADSQFTLYGFMRALEIFKKRVSRKNVNLKSEVYRLVGSKNGTSNLVPVDYVADVLSIAVKKAEKNHIYHITNPNAPKNIDILNMIKDALNFENLSIVESINNFELNEDEKRLNSMVEVFNAYLYRNITFKDNSTRKLIKNSTIEHLDMQSETLRMIIEAYFKI